MNDTANNSRILGKRTFTQRGDNSCRGSHIDEHALVADQLDQNIFVAPSDSISAIECSESMSSTLVGVANNPIALAIAKELEVDRKDCFVVELSTRHDGPQLQ